MLLISILNRVIYMYITNITKKWQCINISRSPNCIGSYVIYNNANFIRVIDLYIFFIIHTLCVLRVLIIRCPSGDNLAT